MRCPGPSDFTYFLIFLIFHVSELVFLSFGYFVTLKFTFPMYLVIFCVCLFPPVSHLLPCLIASHLWMYSCLITNSLNFTFPGWAQQRLDICCSVLHWYSIWRTKTITCKPEKGCQPPFKRNKGSGDSFLCMCNYIHHESIYM